MINIDNFLSFAKDNKISVLTNEPMSLHTTFKIGGKADCFVFANDDIVLSSILQYCHSENIPVYIIGNGSNLLVSDDGLRGVCVKYNNEYIALDSENDNKIVCSAGVSLAKLCKFALENSLSGLEFSFGIPGTVGGAVFMNAGAYGGQMKDVVVSSEHLTQDGIKEKITKEKLNFAYRHSFYSDKNYVITKVVFELKKTDDRTQIRDKMNDFMCRRQAKQPLDLPSAGSTFKRPEGFFAGRLIEDCGLKGAKVGNAQVSQKHAGFVVNTGGATCEDVKNLIDKIKDTVYKKKGVKLECEIKMI